MLATLTPGVAALVYTFVHALRFSACLDEMPLEIVGAWATFSVLGTIPAGLLGAVWLARRRTVGSVEVGRSLGWANVIAGCIALLATVAAAFGRDSESTTVFGIASAVGCTLAGWLLRTTQHRPTPLQA
jgi:hypothetical protein